MATKRMTSNDYAKELHKMELDKIALEKRIRERLRNLCTNHSYIKYCTDLLSNTDIDSIFISSVLNSIKIIEEELLRLHPHKQTEIEFPKTQHEKLMNIAKKINDLNIPKSKK